MLANIAFAVLGFDVLGWGAEALTLVSQWALSGTFFLNQVVTETFLNLTSPYRVVT
jgi:hypothetical protein